MRYRARKGTEEVKADMTPMIDMTFQLIAFFTVLVNFTEADQDQRVTLPSSELAKPPEGAQEMPLFLHVTKTGQVIFTGKVVSIVGLKPLLDQEYAVIDAIPDREPSNATIIIRADKDSEAGRVQQVIKVCQEAHFENFALRAKQEKST